MLKLFVIVFVLNTIDSEVNVTRYADKNEFPNVGSIQNKDPVIHYCTCTLYSAQIAATVAFCVVKINKKTSKIEVRDPSEILVKFGTRYTTTNVDKGFISNVEEIYTSRELKYDGVLQVFLNDAALIKIDPQVENIQPANLALHHKKANIIEKLIETKQNLELVGWNLSPISKDDADYQKIPDDLAIEAKQILNVNLISDKDCITMICKADRDICSIDLKWFNLKCVLPLKARPGLCFAPFGSSLTHEKKLLGMGSSLTIGPKYCNEENTPILITMSDTILNIPQHNEMSSSSRIHFTNILGIISISGILKECLEFKLKNPLAMSVIYLMYKVLYSDPILLNVNGTRIYDLRYVIY